MRTERNYVNGRFVAPESDAFIVVHNPATEAPFARVPAATPADALAAVDAAAAA
ncbi:aldehyde dehydrogenase, partial [Burkholderia sp. HAN2018]|nr:aldehyde dehydrogenase [Burkholderia sp. HAN2018]